MVLAEVPTQAEQSFSCNIRVFSYLINEYNLEYKLFAFGSIFKGVEKVPVCNSLTKTWRWCFLALLYLKNNICCNETVVSATAFPQSIWKARTDWGAILMLSKETLKSGMPRQQLMARQVPLSNNDEIGHHFNR